MTQFRGVVLMLLAVSVTQCKSTGTSLHGAGPEAAQSGAQADVAGKPAVHTAAIVADASNLTQQRDTEPLSGVADPEPPADPEVLERLRLESALGLQFYPASRKVERLCSETPEGIRIVLQSDDPIENIVRFYEQQTKMVASQTDLSQGTVYDLILQRNSDPQRLDEPLWFVQIKPVPPTLQGGLFQARNTILLSRSKR